MKGSLTAWQLAAPSEVYPGEPGDECVHGIPDGSHCGDCLVRQLENDLRAEQEEADYWHDRYWEMAIIADELAESVR